MGDEWVTVSSPCYWLIFTLLGAKVTSDECFSFQLDSAWRVGRYCTLCRLILRALFRLAAWNVENEARDGLPTEPEEKIRKCRELAHASPSVNELECSSRS